MKFPTCEKQNRENTRQKKKKKKSQAQDNIYMVRQFAYVHRVVGFSLLSGKNTKYDSIVFFFSLKKLQSKTLINKAMFSISCTLDSQWAAKQAKKFS